MVKPSTVSERKDAQAQRPSAPGPTSSINVSPVVAVAALAAFLSLASFLYFFAGGMTNVYGDGLAHVNIARKVVDSPDEGFWQRYIQIGSPWLPLQTVLMLPLVANDWMWRSGTAGSVISMLSFVIAAALLYRVAKNLYRDESGYCKDVLPLLSVAIFAINPSILYIQSTPMTELVFMAAMVAAVYALQRWVDAQTVKRLGGAALAMSLATLARYEAWPAAALSILVVALVFRGDRLARARNTALYAAVVAIGPVYWLWHNWAIYGNAIEFLTGPNSARGIYLQNQANLGWSKIFVGNALLDVLTIATATAVCVGPFVLLLGASGFVSWLWLDRNTLVRNSPVLLLAVPFFFHVLSLYRGEIQIFPLSAFGLHNVRYGLPHLLGVALWAPASILVFRGRSRRRAFGAVLIVVAAQYGYLVSEGPSQLAVYQEGYRNGINARAARDRAKVAGYIRANPPDSLVLMNTGALGPVVSQGGLCYSRVIHEGSARWHRLGDGIPADVSTVIVEQGDPLDVRMRGEAALARDLGLRFREELSVGGIRVYERKE